MSEIIARVCVSTRPQALGYQSDGYMNGLLKPDLEVLGVPFLRVRSFLQPLLKLWDCEKITTLLSPGGLWGVIYWTLLLTKHDFNVRGRRAQ